MGLGKGKMIYTVVWHSKSEKELNIVRPVFTK